MSKIVTVAKSGRRTTAFKQLMSLHWLMAGCFLLVYLSGAIVARLQEGPFFSGPKGPLSFFHQSFGTLVMGLLVARICLLLRVFGSEYSRRLPKTRPAWIRTFVLHTVLYCFMLVAPISGFFLSNSYGSHVFFFGVVLPPMFPESKGVVELARSSHFWLSYALLAFILLHIFAQRKVVRSIWRRIQDTLKANILKPFQ